jgi:hypothetical protein
MKYSALDKPAKSRRALHSIIQFLENLFKFKAETIFNRRNI